MTQDTQEQVETVEIEVDGKPVQARKGSMLIEATDAIGIDVPRFCYHKKLPVVANCRMCLVEVERAPKPLPACATPVTDGMKVWTKSEKALDAQRGTLEFLLINHPLDCPICDQGGECELQDLSLGYGEGISRFTEGKRAVADENLGPLIATDMTRCIHCTRCVRFGEEIAGVKELGATGRGEDMRIGTYVGRMMTSELSGNVIDLCPVGALTNKPARYTFRPWELIQHASVSPHDAVGTNLFLHERRGRIMRVVPRENERINETWIADRDRYSIHGLYSDDRVVKPLIKRDGVWEEADWDVAMPAARDALRGLVDTHGADQLGGLLSPYATLEELYLGQKLLRALGTNHVDHRLRQLDFSDQAEAPVMPWLGQSIEQLEALDGALLVGSNVRKQQPLINHRLRKAALERGARIAFLNPRAFDWNYPVHHELVVHPAHMLASLAGVAAAVAERVEATLPQGIRELAGDAAPTAEQRSVAEALVDGEARTILLGDLAQQHPEYAGLRRVAGAISAMAGVRLGYLPDAGNTCGGWLAGAVPHRDPAGVERAAAGLDAGAMIAQPRRGYLLLGVEPEFDHAAASQASRAMEQADTVIAIAAFTSERMLQYADIVLPGSTFAETDGTFVNAEGLWQNFAAAGTAPGDARPGWKILRVLANELGLDGFDYYAAAEVRRELKEQCRSIELDNRPASWEPRPGAGDRGASGEAPWTRLGAVPMYSVDPLVRRSQPLQEAADAGRPRVGLCPEDADSLGVGEGDRVVVRQGDAEVVLDVHVEQGIAPRCAWIPQALEETCELPAPVGEIRIERA